MAAHAVKRRIPHTTPIQLGCHLNKYLKLTCDLLNFLLSTFDKTIFSKQKHYYDLGWGCGGRDEETGIPAQMELFSLLSCMI